MTELLRAAFNNHQAAPVLTVETRVMNILREIRPLRADGAAYDESSVLADVGFTSLEMVKVMLGVEAAFDIMIPAPDITPANFASATTISTLVERVLATA